MQNKLIEILACPRCLGTLELKDALFKQKGDVNDTLADTSRAKELLGWSPKVNIDEGLKKYIKWYSGED